MKTNDFFSKKSTIYSVLGFLGLMLTSCSSYQNKSYYDNDGIYSGSINRPKQTVENKKAGEYKEYFSSLNNQNQQEIFTDVNSYSSYNDSISKNKTQATTTQYSQNNYSGWGNNGSENVTVNVYGNNGGGWNNYGWGGGWNGWYGNNWGYNGWYGNNWGYNGWYGNNWGWGGGWNNWGYNGWYGNNWGYNPWAGNGYYGNGYYGNGYIYGIGRRNSGGYYANENGIGYYNSGRSGNGNRNSSIIGGRRFENNTRAASDPMGIRSTRNYDNNSSVRGTRTEGGTRNYNSNTRNYDTSTPTRNYNNNNNAPTRNYNNNPRTEEATPTRRYSEPTRSYSQPTRSYSEPTRSYSEPSRSSGGSYGGGGGGRSSGGGGGRR